VTAGNTPHALVRAQPPNQQDLVVFDQNDCHTNSGISIVDDITLDAVQAISTAMVPDLQPAGAMGTILVFHDAPFKRIRIGAVGIGLYFFSFLCNTFCTRKKVAWTISLCLLTPMAYTFYTHPL
jgi:hypothetical protein